MVWMPCHRLRVSLLFVKWLLILLPYDRFAFLMPRDRLALAVLRAALSPDLNASSLVFSSPRTSAVIHGFRFARVVMVLVTVTSSMQFLMWAVTVSVYSCRSVWLLYVAASLNMFQSVSWKQSCSAEVALPGHTVICFWTGLASLRSGLYAGVSITEMWSEYPRWGWGSALYAFFTVV